VFSGNSAGGIFLYKNCGEYPDRPAYFERRYPADDNRIEDNIFLGGTNGIWVGSRMGENTLPMDCTDTAYVNSGITRVVEDFASDNTIVGNRFYGVRQAIRVEDDDNRIEANTFHGTGADLHAILVGTPYRTSVLGRPVSGTELIGNVSEIVGNPNPYRWVEGETATTLSGNVAEGSPVGWCRAPSLPRGPFVMTLAVALAGPGGTDPGTTPDLTIPSLAAQPPCPAR
jgi:hypothetical protein